MITPPSALIRISRVVVMLRASRNRVAIRITAGNEENPTGLRKESATMS